MIERFVRRPVESVVGYSRTVRAGDLVFVASCTATTEDGVIVGIGDVAAQTRQVIENIAAALALAGARLEDVVQTRIFTTEIDRWEEIGRVHGEAFGEIRPVAAMYEVTGLLDPRMLVEIEAVAHAPLPAATA